MPRNKRLRMHVQPLWWVKEDAPCPSALDIGCATWLYPFGRAQPAEIDDAVDLYNLSRTLLFLCHLITSKRIVVYNDG